MRIDDAGLCNILIRDGRIADFPKQIGDGFAVSDALGGRLIPGLIDHHIHLLATAAQAHSVDLRGCGALDEAGIAALLREAATKGPVRATGYDEDHGALDRWKIDAICGSTPVRVQHRTGSLWVLNSAALDLVLDPGREVPEAFERDGADRLTGRVWRGDCFLRDRWKAVLPSLIPLGARLARWGITAVTDASATTDQQQADAIAIAAAGFPQKIMLMSGADPLAPPNDRFSVGPVKILLDERDLPSLDAIFQTIAFARAQGRRVAAHCVTRAELMLMVAAFETVGSVVGDRIEHGSLISDDVVPILKHLALNIVSQPGFIHGRGDRYLRRLEAYERGDLYRLASLLDAGVKMAGSSDAPYGPESPWVAIRAATQRRTAGGALIGEAERLTPEQALGLYLGHSDDPGGAHRGLELGAPADLCLLRPNAHVGEDDDPIAMTLVEGNIIYDRNNSA